MASDTVQYICRDAVEPYSPRYDYVTPDWAFILADFLDEEGLVRLPELLRDPEFIAYAWLVDQFQNLKPRVASAFGEEVVGEWNQYIGGGDGE